MQRGYRRSLIWTLRHQPVALLVLLGVVALNVYLYTTIPKTFFPQQDTGVIVGSVQADQGSSFQMMQQRLDTFMATVTADPAVANVNGFTGGGQRNSANFFITLKPLRRARARRPTRWWRACAASWRTSRAPTCSWCRCRTSASAAGSRTRSTSTRSQADDLDDLRTWEPRVRNALMQLPELTDVNTDQQDKGHADLAGRSTATPRRASA